MASVSQHRASADGQHCRGHGPEEAWSCSLLSSPTQQRWGSVLDPVFSFFCLPCPSVFLLWDGGTPRAHRNTDVLKGSSKGFKDSPDKLQVAFLEDLGDAALGVLCSRVYMMF